MELAAVNDQMRWCCKKREFRGIVKQETVEGSTGPAVSTHTRCVVCGNNHYLLEVPPIPFGIDGKSV